MIKRIVAIFLSVLCIAPYLVSCGSREGNGKGTLPLESATYAIDSEIISDVDKYIGKLAKEWYDDCVGKTFTWCGNQGQYPENEEDTGDIKNDALYFRQREIEEKFGIPAGHCMLCATHTHSGPNVAGTSGWGDIDASYCDRIFIPQIMAAVEEALQNARPVKMGTAWGRSLIGINRRQLDGLEAAEQQLEAMKAQPDTHLQSRRSLSR